MKVKVLVLLMIVLVGSSSCSSDASVKSESAVEQCVNKFHDQLNQQQYHEIYAEADLELQSRITELDFTAQLLNAHQQMGTITSKGSVYIDDGFWRALKRVFSRRERITHGNLVASDEVLAHERYVWAIENDTPRLVSYDLGKICRKPCNIVFGAP